MNKNFFCYKSQASQSSYRKSTAQANTMTEIGIRDIFNSDHDILRESARKFFNEEIKPHHDQWVSKTLLTIII